MTTNILTEFNGKRETFVDGNPNDWNNLMDADLKLGPDFATTLKEVFENRLLLPQVQKESAIKAQFSKKLENSSSSLPELYSAILFGPPGTAKTTICTSAATYLGYNFVTIDTASFLLDGLENIASRMTYIFERLKVLEKTIILFDEIEEFCLDRENPNLSMESRMLTTAMLTQLNDLRRQQASIFIVATNRLRSFDAAVTRPGRFDMLLFVGTPNLSARNKRLISKLSLTRLNLDERENARKMVYEVMKSKWDTLRFFTYAENEVFLNRIIDIVNRNEKLDETMLSDIINNILRTSTIQGTIQDEFKASEVLSRL
jgi:SpoVK/Ycf46/Vps4 family AAA+-type ATPase